MTAEELARFDAEFEEWVGATPCLALRPRAAVGNPETNDDAQKRKQVARLPNHSLDHLHTAAADAAWDRYEDARLDAMADKEGEG